MTLRQAQGERDPDADAPEEITWAGRFIVAKRRGRWEYVSRARDIRAAVILPLDEGHVILVEQYRVPLGKQSLELPAGLIGDDESDAGEPVLGAARRELEEETGYRAENWENLGEFYSSPGMVSESFSLLKATGLTKVGAGGGTGHENIAVHRVKLADLEGFIAECRARGVGIDVRLLMLLGSSILAG
jgi:ADP-ribose pyrophosphatase